SDLAQQHRLLAAQHRAAGGRQAQAAVAFGIDFQQAVCDQLPEHAAPGARVQAGADAVHAQPVVAELAHAFAVAAAQHVDQVRSPEALAGAVDAAERHARRFGGIPGFRRLQAVVAVAAGTVVRLAEVAQQHLAAAAHAFAVADQGVELAVFQALALGSGFGLFDHLPQQHQVAEAVAHPGVGRFAVAAGAAGLLVVALDRLGQVDVGDEAHVGLVDAHAEGDRRHHHHAFAAQESALVAGARGRVHAGVVGQGVDALVGEEGGELLHLAPRQAIDDARLAAVPFHEVEQLAFRIVLVHHGVADVGTVEGRDEAARVPELQAFGNLA